VVGVPQTRDAEQGAGWDVGPKASRTTRPRGDEIRALRRGDVDRAHHPLTNLQRITASPSKIGHIVAGALVPTQFKNKPAATPMLRSPHYRAQIVDGLRFACLCPWGASVHAA
jgi:hypothetical protein